MIYLPFTIAGLALATCVYLYRELSTERQRGWRLADAYKREHVRHADELTRVEVDSFAAGYEACAEQMGEQRVVVVERCECVMCRQEQWSVN